MFDKLCIDNGPRQQVGTSLNKLIKPKLMCDNTAGRSVYSMTTKTDIFGHASTLCG